MSVEAPYQKFCETRKTLARYRDLKETQPACDGRAQQKERRFLNFASNDYLGLSRHPLLCARAQEAAAAFGTGSTASRLITGNLPLHAKIEETLARGKSSEAALVMASGYQANVTVLAALADTEVLLKPVTVLADRLSHHSLLQGARLAGARLIRFRHNDYGHLAELLSATAVRGHTSIIVSESVFGMDGDRADIGALIALSRRHDALLYVDEAHATGVFGRHGFGFAAEYEGAVDVAMGTFGKALGGFGAYIACRQTLRDYLIQRCGGLVYSTALPPPVLAAQLAALELLPELSGARAHLQHEAQRLRTALYLQGWDCGKSSTHLIPVLMGDEHAAIGLQDHLKRHDILAAAIRPPTVPQGTSRLRFSLSAVHTAQDIDRLIGVMAEAAPLFLEPKALAS